MNEPWDGASAGAVTLGTFVGAAVIVAAWWGASGSADASHQARFVNVAVGGLLVADANIVGWLITGRRAVGRRRRALLADVVNRQEGRTPVVSDVPDRTVLVSGPGMTRYHLASCDLVAGKQVRRLRAGPIAARLRPCDICRP